MNNYNDFPLLSNEQYKEINSHYNQTSQNNLLDLGSRLQFCIDSFLSIQGNFNTNIENQIKAFTNELKNFKDSLKILYPSMTFNNKKITPNVFLILSKVIEILNETNCLTLKHEKPYYKKVLSKLNTNVLNNLSKFMIILSQQDIKFFIHM